MNAPGAVQYIGMPHEKEYQQQWLIRYIQQLLFLLWSTNWRFYAFEDEFNLQNGSSRSIKQTKLLEMNGCYQSYWSCFDVKDHWPLSCQFRNSRCPNNPLRSEVFWRESLLPMSFLFNSSLCSFNAWRNWRSCTNNNSNLFSMKCFHPPVF